MFWKEIHQPMFIKLIERRFPERIRQNCFLLRIRCAIIYIYIYCIYNGVGDINVGFTTRSMDFTLVARELWEEGKSPLYETAFMRMVSRICQESHVTSKQTLLMKQSCGNKKGACFMHLKQIC